MDQVYKTIYHALSSLQRIVEATDQADNSSIKRSKNYLQWIATKSEMIATEDIISIPSTAIPLTVTSFVRSKLSVNDQSLFDQYYNQNGNEYVLDRSLQMSDDILLHFANMLVLTRGKVVWVEFGFNISNEFGGKHPAIILKKVNDGVIVIPLSTAPQASPAPGWIVPVDRVYSYRNEQRWANVLRIREVAIKRIDFHSPVGSVKGEVLTNISTAIASHGVR